MKGVIVLHDKVKIGCTTYDVIDTDEDIVFNGDQCNGIIEYDNGIIKISNTVGPQLMNQVWWHEVVHGIMNDRDISTEDDEEAVVDKLAKGLYALMQDNNFLMPGQKGADAIDT